MGITNPELYDIILQLNERLKELEDKYEQCIDKDRT